MESKTELPVFIVDDNESDRYLMTRAIEETGINCRIHQFVSGDEFLEAFINPKVYESLVGGSREPAMVLLDINMPRLDGFEVLEEINKWVAPENYMVIFMITSSSNELDRKRAANFKIVKDFDIKPLEEQKIRAFIERNIWVS